MASLQGKTALVTGALRGIGRATALALAKAGARVLVHYGRSAQDAESVVAAIRSEGGSADSMSADLATADGPMLLAKQVRTMAGERLDKREERIDIVFVDAGIGEFVRFRAVTEEHFDKLFNINVRGTLFTLQKALPLLRDGGSIILNGSVASARVLLVVGECCSLFPSSFI
jgi:3-oxoacyl-[acyl-carrier protein] reductase